MPKAVGMNTDRMVFLIGPALSACQIVLSRDHALLPRREESLLYGDAGQAER